VALNWRKYLDANTIGEDLNEVRELATQYVKEETVEPVKDLWRFARFGCLGSIFVALGSVFALIGILRLLQAEVPMLDGNLSWVPYLVVITLGLAEIGLVAWRIFAGPAQRRRTDKKAA
jgi:hypothetical protein